MSATHSWQKADQLLALCFFAFFRFLLTNVKEIMAIRFWSVVIAYHVNIVLTSHVAWRDVTRRDVTG